MINGTVDIANASRQMKQKEVDLAKPRGQDPVEHVVGYDALAVFLHPDNPLDTIGIMAQARRASEEWIFTLLGKVIEHAPTGDMFVAPRRRETADYIEGRYG